MKNYFFQRNFPLSFLHLNNNSKIKNILSVESKNMKLNQIKFYKKFSLRLKKKIEFINSKIVYGSLNL